MFFAAAAYNHNDDDDDDDDGDDDNDDDGDDDDDQHDDDDDGGATKVSQAFSRLHNSAAALPMIAALSSAPKFAYKYRKISQISENVFTNIEKFAYKYVYGCLQICFKWRKIWLQICLIPNIYLKVPGSTLKYSDVPQSNLKVPRCDEIPAYIYLAKHASLIKLFISQKFLCLWLICTSLCLHCSCNE